MIQPAAPSVSSSLALNTGTQAAQGDDAAVSGDFSALLSSSLATGQDAAGDAAAPLDQSAALQLRQDGKAAGKSLPLGLPDLNAALAQLAQTSDSGAQGAAPAADTTSTLPTATAEVILPDLVLRLASQAVQTATATAEAPPPADKSTAESLVLASAAQAIRSPRAAIAETASAAKPVKAQAAKKDEAETDDTPEDTAADTIPALALPETIAAVAAADPATNAPVAVPVSVTTQPTIEIAVAPDAPAAARTADNRPQANPVIVATAAKISLAGPTIATTTTTTDDASVPADTAQASPSATIRLASDPAVNQAGPTTARPTTLTLGSQAQTASAAKSDVTVQVPVGPVQPAPAAPQPDDHARTAIEALPRTVSAPADDVAPASGASVSAPAQLATDAAEPQAPVAAAPQPALTVPDMQVFSQTVDAVATTPATTTVRQAGHDFTALVDRLVEAREAAVPQSVGATISHGEFGQVSLRFDQDAGGLSVAMSSPDPDFARAVQASAASTQSQTTSDNGSNASRQDASAQQQTSGSASGQPQPQSNSQANSQPSARNDRSAPAQTNNRSGSLAGEQGQDDESADARAGIYA